MHVRLQTCSMPCSRPTAIADNGSLQPPFIIVSRFVLNMISRAALARQAAAVRMPCPPRQPPPGPRSQATRAIARTIGRCLLPHEGRLAGSWVVRKCCDRALRSDRSASSKALLSSRCFVTSRSPCWKRCPEGPCPSYGLIRAWLASGGPFLLGGSYIGTATL